MRETLADSVNFCRICGHETAKCVYIFESPEFCQDLNFFLPIECKQESPFPQVLCHGCAQEFTALKSFIIKLNEGQALLAERLQQVDGIVVKMPNYLADKRSLFKDKFPCAPKHIVAPKAKSDKPTLSMGGLQNDRPSRRARKLPVRLAESVQGSEFEKMFNTRDEQSMLGNDGCVQTNESAAASIDQEVLTFDGGPKANVHLRSKSRQRNKCDICSKVFKLQGRLAHHRSLYHKGAYFQCSTEGCGKQYKTRESMILHHKTVQHEGYELFEPCKHTCSKCNTAFSSKSMLEEHNIEEHYILGGPMKCSSCLQSFNTFHELKDHAYDSHGVENFKELACYVCSKILPQPSALLSHTEEEHKDIVKVFTCKICSRPFKNKTLLTRHLSIVHSDSRPYSCDNCEATFKSSTNLKSHQAIHTGVKKYSCDVCGKLFSYKTSLDQHIKVHEGDKPFECPHCSKRFTQNGNLQEHIRIHTGEKPFSCSLCFRKFTTSSQHKIHEKRHKGEKPWQCEHCPKAFLHKVTYKAHVRRHTGEKPYSCDLCFKAFTESWALKKHQRVHTGERPYKCDQCGKAYADSSNLAKHSKAHVKAGDEIGAAKEGSVWNIINHAAASTTNPENSDVQQIIYIAYEDGIANSKETAIHIINQAEGNNESQTVELDLSQFSEGTRLQLENAASSDQDDNPAFHVISQEDLRVDEEEKMDPSVQYVDLTVKEGQHIRLKVPAGTDPIAYAKEYLHQQYS